MNMLGHPLKITGKEVKNTYKKCSSKDEVAPGELNKLIPSKYSLQDFYKTQPIFDEFKKKKISKIMSTDSFLSRKNKNEYSLSPTVSNIGFKSYKTNAINENIDKNNIFITENSLFSSTTKNRNLKIYDNNFGNNYEEDLRPNTFYDILNQNKFSFFYNNYNNYNKINKDFSNNFDSKNLYTFNRMNNKEQNKFYNFIKNINMKNNLIIKYYYFELVIDDEYNLFKRKNKRNWKKINNILANYNILFEKLNINKAFIDSNKILKLIEFYHGNTKNITNKDLLMCLTKSDLKEKGYDPDNEYLLYGKIKEAFIIRIQKAYRKRLGIKKYKEMKYLYDSLIILFLTKR
jgi:hypothetical protein